MTAAHELAKYLTIAQAARVLDVPESRFRASWRLNGIAVLATRQGLIQVRRQDVVRAAVLAWLQAILGEQSSVAVELAKAMSPEKLEVVLDVPLLEK